MSEHDPRPDRGRDRDGRGDGGAESDAGRRALPRNRYSALVGLVFVAVAAVALYNTLTAGEPGTLGLGGEEPGSQLERFAVPEVRSDLTGDANIDPGEACAIGAEGAIRICDFFDRPLVVSFWFDAGAGCAAQQDLISDAARRFGDRAGFLSINVRDDREEVRALAEERDWAMPVGHDRDGAVSNLYRVGGCPTHVFAEPGGRLHDVAIGELDRAQMYARVRDLLAASASGLTGRGSQAPASGRAGHG